MKICLVRCPCISLPYPPLIGLAYINSFLKAAGHKVFIFDLNVELFHCVDADKKKRYATPDTTELIKLSEDIFYDYKDLINEHIKKIMDTETTVVGFSVWNSNIIFSLKLAREIKRINKDITIIFGGPACFPKWSGLSLIQENCFVDAVVYGEGEETLKEILYSLERTGTVGFCSGALVKDGFNIIDCGEREPIKNLDNMPFPDFDGFPLDKYMTDEMPILFNRGCPRKCAYCSVPGTIPSYRWRSANSIYEEMKYHISKYRHVDSFHADSPSLNSSLKELSKLCDLIIQGGLDMRWSGFAFVDKNMDLSLLKKMKEAGCFGLNFGLESGSQKVIDKMQRSYSIKDAEKNIRDTYNAGIETVLNFIVGFPGESEDDFQQTLDFILRNREYISYVGSADTCRLEPYAQCYEHSEKYGITIVSDGFDWSCQENDYQTRKARKARLKAFIDSNKIGITFPKLPDKP